MKTCGGMEVQVQTFSNLTLDEGDWSASCPGNFTLRDRGPGIHWMGGWVGTRAYLDMAAKRKIPCPYHELNPGHTSHNLVTTLTELPWLLPLSGVFFKLH